MEQTLTINTFEEACTAKGLDPQKVLPDVSLFPEAHQKALIAAAKLFIIVDAMNGGWQPDWNNDDRYKYYPWFDLEQDDRHNPSGFSLYYVHYYCTSSYVGSRLCFRTRELAEQAATKFLDLYRDLMVL